MGKKGTVVHKPDKEKVRENLKEGIKENQADLTEFSRADKRLSRILKEQMEVNTELLTVISEKGEGEEIKM